MSHSAKVEMWIDAEDGKRYEVHTVGTYDGRFMPFTDGVSGPGHIAPTLGTIVIKVDGVISTNDKIVFWNCQTNGDDGDVNFRYQTIAETTISFIKEFIELNHRFTIAKMICDQAEGKDCLIGPAAFRSGKTGWQSYNAITLKAETSCGYKTLFDCVLARFPNKESLTTSDQLP